MALILVRGAEAQKWERNHLIHKKLNSVRIIMQELMGNRCVHFSRTNTPDRKYDTLIENMTN